MKGDGWKHVAYHLMYQVDLSDFNPAEAPPMTEFLRDIKEASKSPMQQTIESFIHKELGAFKCDLVTCGDMSETLKSGAIFAPSDMYTDGRYFSPTKVGMIIKEIGGYSHRKIFNNSYPVKLIVLRNREKYDHLSSRELYDEYYRQMTQVRGEAQQLQVVKG